MATKTAMIRARVEPDLKDDAENILKKLGLKPSQAITLFYKQVVLNKKVPFEISLSLKKEKKVTAKVNFL